MESFEAIRIRICDISLVNSLYMYIRNSRKAQCMDNQSYMYKATVMTVTATGNRQQAKFENEYFHQAMKQQIYVYVDSLSPNAVHQ